MAKILRSMTLFALFALAVSVHARNDSCQFQLTLKGDMSDSAIFETTAPGTILNFPDGKSFEIQKVISRSGSNGIFLTKDNKVLRVSMTTPYMIEAYHTGYRTLVERHIPVPRMFGANPLLWVVTEFLDIEFTLHDLLREGTSISAQRFEQLREEFGNFAFKFAGLNKVGDLSLQNIAYVRNRGWMLIDWADGHRVGYKLNPFLEVFGKTSEGSVVEIDEQKYSKDRLTALRKTSDQAIAFARAHDVTRYSQMTQEEFNSQIYDR